MGTEWITCSGKTWKPAPQCLAPCSLTKQQLETKNLLLSSGRRHAQLILSDHTLEFMCSEGYTLATPSVRKCVNGHMDLPSCISERGKNCSRPPTIENGDITTFLEKGYTSGSFVEFKCQKFYAMEGLNRSFCDNGNWTKAPLCLEPCAISVEEMENQMVELNGRANETISQWMYLKRGDFLELRCKPGYALATNLSQSAFMVQCHGNPVVYLECKEIRCDPPTMTNGTYYPKKKVFRELEVIRVDCNKGFHFETDNRERRAECTKNGWLPIPRCILRPCDYPHIENGALTDYYEYYKERAFPAQLGVSIYYRCLDGYVSEREERWPLIRCTKASWSPAPKCLKKCSPGHLENGKFIFNYWTTYKEGDEISYVCVPENLQAKVTCTKNGWSPTPICTSNKICGRTEVPHGYFYETKNRFDLNEKATYRCQIGYTTPEGNETGEIQCLEEGWSPFPECIKTCRMPAFEHIHFNTSKMVFLPEDILEYECADGYQTLNRISRGHTICSINGWTPEPQCFAIECEMVMLAHGEAFPKKDKYLNGDVMTFSCAKRYTRVGPDSAQCYYFGWSPAPPTCQVEIKDCGPPPSITNGNIISELHEKYQHGDSVEYDCNLRFKMIGSKNIECVDGEWSSSPVCIEEEKMCVPPPSIVRGSAINVNQNQYFHGDSVEYGCEGNLEIVGTNIIKCLSGEWTSLPSCADPSVKCVLPRNLENIGFLSVYNFQKSFYHKDVVKYRCNSDVKKLKQTVCEYGKWSPKPECIENKRKCPPPPQLPGASKITEKRSYETGEKIAFTCLENFKLHGVKEIMCEDGKWQSPPHCIEKKSCLQPYPVENGEILSLENQSLRMEQPGPVTYPNGETLKYICNAGFMLRGPSEITCNMEKWTSPPACIEMPCRVAPDVPHAQAEGSVKTNYEPGETVRYQCHPGFVAVGSQEVTCKRGQWTQLPECQDVTCGDPPAVANAEIIDHRHRRYWPAERVQYQCHEGFESHGPNDVTCINREWSQPPTCEDMTCGPPPAVTNGQILEYGNQRYLPGERVRYRCQQGLSLIGSQTVTCQKQKWSEPPECREAGGKCGPPPRIDNGDIVSFPLKQYVLNSTVEYKCKSLHILKGPQSVRCDSGQWTDPPVCLEPCTITLEDMERNKIQLRWPYEQKFYVLSGIFVQFVCKWGYKLDPTSSGLRVQCLEGSLEYPKCKHRKK
ncbi:unnamed protein product [Natator depressus]